MYHIANDKRQIQSVGMIIEGLSQLINEKPYEQITVKDVAEKAKVGRTTFYRSFDEINDVLLYEYDNLLNELYEYIKAYLNNQAISKEKNIMKPALRFFYVNDLVTSKLISAGQYEMLQSGMYNMLRGFVQKNVNIESDYEEYYVELRCAIWTSIFLTWMKNDKNIPPDTLTEVITNHIAALFRSDLLED